ncbi:MAG: sulfatase-like hydrolase/transferase [Planctomycetota bacterium]|jgi:hypothetical protein
MLNRRIFLGYAGLTAASAIIGDRVLTAAELKKQTKPNILIIIGDDSTYNDLPLYGGQNALTPNIDRLGSEGLVFNRAYLCSSMCQPCRAELYTGQYPMRNGCAWNSSASRPDVTSMPDQLRLLASRRLGAMITVALAIRPGRTILSISDALWERTKTSRSALSLH